MNIGDQVKVIAVPEKLPEGMGTKALFESCIGRTFPIADIKGELLELEVGEVAGEQSHMHSIWIERHCVRLVHETMPPD
jgi:hypothetical protein